MSKLTSILLCVALFLSGCSSYLSQTAGPVGWKIPYATEFLYWCEQEGQWPVYEKPPACDKVSRGEWDHYPITVNAEDALQQETLEAIEAFNTQVGFQLFAYQTTNLEPDVAVVAAGFHPMAIAQAKQVTYKGRHHGQVLAYNGLEHMDLPEVIMHELGHIVGLRHDYDNHLSVMYSGKESKVAALELQDVWSLRTIYLD